MFIEKPVNKASLAMRRKVYGIGINDANYVISLMVDGKHTKCPFYGKWKNVLTRCYSAAYHKINPSYIGCSIHEDWVLFSNFKAWMITKDWEGNDLDKDILVRGNRIYSPENCVFVSEKINNLLNDNKFRRGDNPIWSHFCNQKNKFISKCNVDGKSKHLGAFDTPEEASSTYKKFKSELVYKTALEQSEPLRSALIRISNEYKNKTSN